MTKRARSARREAERAAEKLVRDRRKLHALEPGGAVDNPIEVSSASVIEPHGRSLPCARCGPHLRIVDQSARVLGGLVRRVLVLECARCGEPRVAHYAIVAPLVQ
ncbi:MAG: hypothetical protein FJ096_12250 [Deltaproteobacteria bacterium]|nr:hypothetical protein [Deltaproteobacteria bacterium]